MAIDFMVIDEIRDKSDIIDVVSHYVHRKKAGKSWMGVCPFHSEKLPSFSVKPDGLYYCFGCGAGGDVFNFIKTIENLTFIEAVEELAKRVGVEIPRGRRPEERKKTDYYEMYNEAARFYHDNLTRKVVQYLKEERGLRRETIDKWQIGYALPEWDALLLHLQRHFPQEELYKAGLLSEKRSSDGYYDFFRDRIMIPIKNTQGKIVAFGARDFSEFSGVPQSEDYVPAKFINTPDTIAYSKSKTLLGFSDARAEIGRRGEAIVIEGYFDTIVLQQEGFLNSVAPCGTSLTDEHIDLLLRATPRVNMCPDQDASGISKAISNSKRCLQKGLEVVITNIEEGDPDEAVLKDNGKTFARQVSEAKPLINFAVDTIHHSESVDNVISIIHNELYDIIDSTTTPLHKRLYLVEVCSMLQNKYPDFAGQFKIEHMMKDYWHHLKKNEKKRETDWELIVLSYLARIPAYRRSASETLAPEYFGSKMRQLFFSFITDTNSTDNLFVRPKEFLEYQGDLPLLKGHKEEDLRKSFVEHFRKMGVSVSEDESLNLFAQLSLEQNKYSHPKCIKILKNMKVSSKIKEFERELKHAERERNREKAFELTWQLKNLAKQIEEVQGV
ncbi:DNA primase [Candidatus Woesearchaeota archaeon]|nr:DNA primase [Candidatus Woesearchaeota archaeon]